LNSYFYGFSDAPMFDPRRDYTGAGISVMRLPTIYNADLGLYVINGNRWTLQPEEIR
jgi:inositol phosphorylceramide glucuronosyltransferase 1